MNKSELAKQNVKLYKEELRVSVQRDKEQLLKIALDAIVQHSLSGLDCIPLSVLCQEIHQKFPNKTYHSETLYAMLMRELIKEGFSVWISEFSGVSVVSWKENE